MLKIVKRTVRIFIVALAFILLAGCLSGCIKDEPKPERPPESQPAPQTDSQPNTQTDSQTDTQPARSWQDDLAAKLAALPALPENPVTDGNCRTWYQVFVYSFYDSNGDGIGDLRGVTERLDYIQSMGFDGIWLSPIHPSDTYHKYNVRDYIDVDPQYGTLEDFGDLIQECHRRGLRVLLDLVINHTDLYHPWFTEHPEYYNIADTPGNGNWAVLPDGRYYECQFWDHMPDLNLENPDLRAEIVRICAFWFDRGVDGFRLDAVKEYVTGNTAKNIEILSWFTETVKRLKPDAYLVGEAWDTTVSLYDYYKSGIDSMFDFPFAGSDGAVAQLMLRSDASVSDYLNKIAAVQQTIVSYNPKGSDAPFFTNHDMSRASGFLRRDAGLIKTAWGLSLTMPGDAFVYYGEELGMTGSGKDENKRAPMFWTDDPQAPGMTLGPPDREAQANSFPPAVEQAGDPDSIFAYITNAVRLRRAYPQIGRGTFEIIPASSGTKACAVRRAWLDSEIIIVYNVSADSVEFALPGVLQDFLSATGEQPSQDGGVLTLPGYCIAVLKE